MASYDSGGLDAAIRQIQATTKPPACKLAAGSELHGAQATMHEQDGHSVVRLPLAFRRQHRFTDPLSLAAWLHREADPSMAEVLVGDSVVTALVNGRDVDQDVVTVALTEHPIWARWAAQAKRPMSHKALHKLLRVAVADTRSQAQRGRDDVISAGEKLLVDLGKLEVRQVTTFKQEVDERGLVTLAAADAKTDVSVKLPPEITIHVPIYVDVEIDGVEPVYEIKTLVSVDVAEGKAVFSLEFPDLPIVMLQARKDVAACLRERLGEGWLVGLGEARQELVVLQDPRPLRWVGPPVPFSVTINDGMRPAPTGDCNEQLAGSGNGEATPPEQVGGAEPLGTAE